MTEAEAKTKWCPMVRPMGMYEDENAGQNRGQKGQLVEGSFCIASDCMMWRESKNQKDFPGDGYCGLGGKP